MPHHATRTRTAGFATLGRAVLLPLALFAMLIGLSACGSGGDDAKLTATEQKVADNIATKFSSTDGDGLSKKQATCFAEKFVKSAGVKELRDAKLIGKDNKVLEDQTAKFDKPLSTKYADAYLDCVDFAEEVASTYAKADTTLDEAKLKKCLDEDLPDSLMKKAIVANQTGDTSDENLTKGNKALENCVKNAKKSSAK